MNWVIEKIQLGYVDVVNPFNRKQISRVSLKPEDVKCWVWWSKNFAKWIEYYNRNLDLFRLYKGHYFQFTINTPSELEKNITVSLENRFKQLEWLIKEFGSLAVDFRFDPIILYKKHDSDKMRSNLSKFEYIIENISSLGLNEMIFSFATIYPKVKTRMTTRGYIPIDPPFNKKKEVLTRLMEICMKNNVKIKACCQPDLLIIDGIEQAHCIDAYKIEQIIGETIPKIRDTGQRKDCGCFKSKDIGGYSGIFRCKHNCDYCYASPAKR
jgi:DNA repair photolyase